MSSRSFPLVDPVHVRRWILLAGLGVLCAGGCRSLPRPFAARENLENDLKHDPNYSIAAIQGPTERKLNAARWQRQRDELTSNPTAEMAEALRELESAQKLYDAGKYPEASKAFKTIAANRRKKYESFRARWERWWGIAEKDIYNPYANFGDPIEEDALFMLAQSQFAEKRYAKAQDTYDELLNKYPSTRHLDQVTRQLFRIARYWLDFPDDVGETGDAVIQLASNETPSEALEQHPSTKDEGFDPKGIPILPNFTDRTRPMFDTYGRGLQALRSIWLHDATGPLADDALMLAANHNLRKENFIEAARLYSLLREQYPDSPHFKDAYVLGSHVALASYEGPAYDATSLNEAIELKETTLQLFRDLTPDERQRFSDELRRLHEAEIARQWDIVQFYQRKGIPESVALHCYLIINRYPDSRFAEMARQTLLEIEPQLHQQPSNGGWATLLRGPRTRPQGKSKSSTSPDSPVTDDQNRITLPAAPHSNSSAPKGSHPESDKPKRTFFENLLRRPDSPPKLIPVPDSEQSADSPGKASL